MKNVLIVHTGGTISMLQDKHTGNVSPSNTHPLAGVSSMFKDIANVEEYIIYSLPSPQMTPALMLELANYIESQMSNYDAFVVTHGTDTLEETAYFLDLVMDTEKPIIITGAMRSSNEIGSDALYNLIAAVRTAACNESVNQGVLVVLNDEIHTAENVTKTSTSNIATFQSPQFGPLGLVTNNSVIFHHKTLAKPIYHVRTISKKVYLLKAFAGMDQALIQAISNLNPDGLVIEAMGQGNLPKETVSALQKIINKRIPVILVSRCYRGIVQPTYGYDGGGRQLYEMGIIFTNGLTGPKARIKLLIALEYTNNLQQIASFFQKES